MNSTPPSLCPHFGDCGGCQTQDLPYLEQLARKQADLEDLFAPYWPRPVPIEPSPAIWRYRNRLDLQFGLKRYPEPPPEGFERETVLGFKRRGRWYWPLDILACRIGPEDLENLLDAVRDWYRTHGLRAFDSRKKTGFLRTLLVREGKRNGQRMVVLITSPGDLDTDSFVQTVQSAYPAHSVQWGTLERPAEVTEADALHLLDGAPAIEEHVHVPVEDGPAPRPLRFRISPFSFFQTNTLAAELLYGRIRAQVRALAPSTLYDLYGGAGGIALTCASLVEHVVSVENVESASRDGRHNASINNVPNVEFITQKVEHYLRDLKAGQRLEPDSAVILDPPRAGLHPKALRRLIELRPPAILYASCKPSVFAAELPRFLETYRLDAFEAFDFFPHTKHVEALARLVLDSPT